MIASAFKLVSLDLLIPTTLGVLVALATNEVVKAKELRNLRNSVSEFGSNLSSFLRNSGRIFALDPSSFDDYVVGWGDYEGDMFAFNPTFEESPPIQRDYERVIERVYVARYKNPQFFKAHYLFFTGDDTGRRQLDLFKDLMKRVAKKTKSVRTKIFIKQTCRPNPICEFYVAKKANGKYFVLEHRGIPLEETIGLPKRVFAGWDDRMFDLLYEVFEREWQRADNIQVPIDEILGP